MENFRFLYDRVTLTFAHLHGEVRDGRAELFFYLACPVVVVSTIVLELVVGGEALLNLGEARVDFSGRRLTVHVEGVGRVLGCQTGLESLHSFVQMFTVLKHLVKLLVVFQLVSGLIHISEFLGGHSFGHRSPAGFCVIKTDDRGEVSAVVVFVVRVHLSQIPLD